MCAAVQSGSGSCCHRCRACTLHRRHREESVCRQCQREGTVHISIFYYPGDPYIPAIHLTFLYFLLYFRFSYQVDHSYFVSFIYMCYLLHRSCLAAMACFYEHWRTAARVWWREWWRSRSLGDSMSSCLGIYAMRLPTSDEIIT